ncbi:beta-lactamase family protein [Streptomyces sp. XM83C]|uniref:serine hydrolase domain-containing protein n=1 Tax=Streptomyces sp. XM83C TaxID=2929781 RepID=UPI001FFACC32|nr:serine hydrolase domain-containing protein [Streptomyces sp. XM83C]MCK1822169.1 beta-lactamase family protein [Streptomyces sp. XM83C]
MTLRPLPESSPAAQGVDAAGVHAFLDALEAAPGIAPHSVMIVRHDRLVAAGWWAPYTPDRPQLLYSISKSFTGTAAGLARAEGLLDLDAPVVSYFPEFESDITDPRSRELRVRHVASMSAGHTAEALDHAMELDPDDLVRGFLLLPPDRDPGTVFAYSQPTTFTLAAIVRKVTGQGLVDYLRPRLFEPLGIEGASWLCDRSGRELGFSGLHATTDAVARLGLLFLRRGRWQGRQVLPEEWVAEASRPHIATAPGKPDEERGDWDLGYGLQFWMSRHGYRGDGAFGQFCLVLPEQDAVVAVTSETRGMQDVLDAVWEHLLPAFGPAPLAGREEADTALRDRLAALALPAAPGKPAPPEDADAWAGTVFTPGDGTCPDLPGLTGAELSDGPDGWTLTLTEDGHPLPLRLGPGDWTVTEEPLPVAVSGGWTDAGTLGLDVAVLETPHRLEVTCSLAGRTLSARWRTTPLHPGPLRTRRAPRPPAPPVPGAAPATPA